MNDRSVTSSSVLPGRRTSGRGSDPISLSLLLVKRGSSNPKKSRKINGISKKPFCVLYLTKVVSA